MMDALRSSVRPLVTMALTGAFIAGFFLGRIPQDAFVPMVSVVVGFWFQSRTQGGGE